MAITKRPAASKPTSNVDEFISRAPDAAHEQDGEQAREPERRRKQVISVGIDPALLARVDAAAARLGISRNAAIALAASRFVDTDRPWSAVAVDTFNREP